MVNGNAIHFGAGNIGRGFIGPLLSEAGYHVTFADIDEALIDELENRDEYQVHFLEQRKRRSMTVTNYSGVLTSSDNVNKAIADPETKLVTTSVGIAVLPKIASTIALGIAERRKQGVQAAMNIIACENGVGATDQLRQAVFEHLSTEDKCYAEQHIGFANCAVDRIVPPFESDRPLDVGVESFYEWSVDKTSLKDIGEQGSLGIKGMHLTEDLLGFVERKLFILNGGHAVAAYVGYLKGCDTIFDSMQENEVSILVQNFMKESSAALVKKHPIFPDEEQHRYIQMCLDRFSNPKVVDDVRRVGREPMRKLSRNDRLLGPIYLALEHRLPIDNLCYGVAAAISYDNADDPQAAELQDKMKSLGVEKTIEDITGFKRSSHEFQAILTAYEKLQAWREH